MSTQENPITLLNKVVKSNSNSKNTSPQPYSVSLNIDKKLPADRYIITDNKKMYISPTAPQVFQPKPISVVSIIMDTSIKKTSPKHSDFSLHKRPEHTLISPVSSFKIGDFSLFTSDLDHPEKTNHSDHAPNNLKTLPKLQLSSIATARSDSNFKDINVKKTNPSTARKLKAASNSSTPLKTSPRPLLNSYRPSDFSKSKLGIPNVSQNNSQKAGLVKPLPLNTERIKNSSGNIKLTISSSQEKTTGRRPNKSESGPTVMSARQVNHAFETRPTDLTVDFKDCFKPVLNSKSKVLFKNAEILLKKYKDLKLK